MPIAPRVIRSRAPHDTHLRAGTRSSRLAVWQTDLVASRLQQASPGLLVERVLITTLGDRISDVPLPRIGDKGIFTRELEDALRAGTIDLAVHSLKDLPTDLPRGLMIGAVLQRSDPRDALVAASTVSIDTLQAGARVGTSSLRRRAQLLARRPDLDVRDLRGNVPTRVDKVLSGDLDAAVLAVAGLARLGLSGHIAEVLGTDLMLPAPGQGALAVEIRADDERTGALVALLDDSDTRLATTAERSLLAELEGGCQAPVGALATFTSDGVMRLEGLVIDLDGHEAVRRVVEAPVTDRAAASALGQAVAAGLRAGGARAILARARQTLAGRGADVPES